MLISFPLNLLVAIPFAIFYCFVFYKADFLSNYKKGLFRYSLFIQAIFLFFYSLFSLFLTHNQTNTGIARFGDGLIMFYIAIVVPY